MFSCDSRIRFIFLLRIALHLIPIGLSLRNLVDLRSLLVHGVSFSVVGGLGEWTVVLIQGSIVSSPKKVVPMEIILNRGNSYNAISF